MLFSREAQAVMGCLFLRMNSFGSVYVLNYRFRTAFPFAFADRQVVTEYGYILNLHNVF